MQTETSGRKIEGTLYTICPVTSLIVISTGSAPSTFHVLPIASLLSFTLLSISAPALPEASHVAPFNTSALSDRANNVLAREKEKASKRNRDVDRATQELFDGLDKQFSARWKGRDIIVMERVAVRAPGYRSEDCKIITKDGEGLLGRVRKVVSSLEGAAARRWKKAYRDVQLENERRRAVQKEGGKTVKPAIPNILPAIPAPQGPRKGG